MCGLISSPQIAYSGLTMATKQNSSVGQRIVEGLDEAIAWSQGKKTGARVTLVTVPDVDVRQLRQRMGLSQSQFATRFGLPPGTLRNWEQGRSEPPRAAQGRTRRRGSCWR